MNEFLGTQGKALEDAFFLEEDRRLIERMKALKKLEETRTSLAAVSGISDAALLDKLIALDVSPDLLASLAIVPLVEVAWADGKVEEAERKAIERSLDGASFAKGIDKEIVDAWLERRPGERLMEAWTLCARELGRELGGAQGAAFSREVLGHARAVAEAAGGFLGRGKVSREEEAVLARLAAAFEA